MDAAADCSSLYNSVDNLMDTFGILSPFNLNLDCRTRTPSDPAIELSDRLKALSGLHGPVGHLERTADHGL